MNNFFEENKSVESLIENTISNLHTLAETNTVVGEPIFSPDGSIIIPISKVSVGFVVGGGEYTDISKKKHIENYPLAGGSGGGMTVSPVGFLIENTSGTTFIDIENKTAYQAIINLVDKIINSVGGKKNEK